MVSVCMATKNGGRFIKEQLDSILPQLKTGDEIVIVDDFSRDNTVGIIRSFQDPRIRVIETASELGISKSFEASLNACKGQYIFLADQDDVWLSGKVDKMRKALQHYDLVMSDCHLVDNLLQVKESSFYQLNNSGKGFLKNLFRNSYMGCCMAFTKTLRDRAIPFPKDIPMHDFWIGLIGEVYFEIFFMPEILVLHRRHNANASTSGGISRYSTRERLIHRFRLVKNLFMRKYYAE